MGISKHEDRLRHDDSRFPSDPPDTPLDPVVARERQQLREDLLARVQLERRVAELEATLAERDQALRIERARARAVRRASSELVEATRQERAEAREHARELSQARARMREVDRDRRDLEDRVEDLERRQRELSGERATVHTALAAAQEAIEALEEQLRAAGQVQRISKFIGNLSFPKGAEDLRTGRPDHPLYETLLTAQQQLKARWLKLIDLRERLGSVQSAVRDQAEGEAFRRAEVAALQEALERARGQSDTLRRTCRVQAEALEQLGEHEEQQAARGERIAELERALHAARDEAAKTARMARSTTASLRREELLRRTEQRDALQALAAAEQRIAELERTAG